MSDTFRPASCHPEKRLLARGLCAACYARANKAKLAERHFRDNPNIATGSLTQALKIAAGGQMSIEEAIRMTKQELILALPEAARALRHAIASDPHRGMSVKAASLVLKAFQVPIDGQLQPFLKNPPPAAPAPAQTQIVVGLHVGNGGEEEPRMGRVVGTVGPLVHPKRPNK